jgi:hypothetical protein
MDGEGWGCLLMYLHGFLENVYSIYQKYTCIIFPNRCLSQYIMVYSHVLSWIVITRKILILSKNSRAGVTVRWSIVAHTISSIASSHLRCSESNARTACKEGRPRAFGPWPATTG